MSINPLTGCTLSPRVLWAEMLMGGQVYLIILTSLGRSLALQSTSGGETRWVWASLAGVWQERPVTDRSTPPLRPLSEAEVEESISCPQLPTAWPSTGGLWLPLFIHPCAGFSVGGKPGVSLWEKFPLSPIKLLGKLFFRNVPPWLLVPMGPVGTSEEQACSCTPGTGAARGCCQPAKAHQGCVRTKRHRWAESCTGTVQF